MSGSQLHIHANLQHPLENTPSNHSPLQLIDTGARFVDIEASDDDHLGCNFKVPLGDGDIADGLADGIDVVSLFG